MVCDGVCVCVCVMVCVCACVMVCVCDGVCVMVCVCDGVMMMMMMMMMCVCDGVFVCTSQYQVAPHRCPSPVSDLLLLCTLFDHNTLPPTPDLGGRL